MSSSRTSAARRLRRFLAPTSLSVLLHVFLVLQAAPAMPERPVASTPIDVYLTSEPERDPTPPVSTTPHAGPATPGAAAPSSRPAGGTSAGRRRSTRVRVRAAEPSAQSVTEAPPEPHVLPPRPVGLAPVELAIVPRSEPRELATEAEPSADGAPEPGEPRPAVAPLYHQPPGAEKSTSMPTPAGTGMGASFDFWSPPVFAEEMARATEKIGRAEAEHQRAKNTDLGHGVICNTGNGWFVCAHDDIGRCNRLHDGNCRYAKPEERYQLEIDHIF